MTTPAIPRDRALVPGDEERGRVREGALWYGVFAAPAAWSVDTLVAFSLHTSYCAAVVDSRLRPFAGVGLWLALLGLVTAAIAASGGLIAWRSLRALGDDTGRDGTHLDRRRFMAHFGLVITGLFLFGILLRWVSVAVVSTTICTLVS